MITIPKRRISNEIKYWWINLIVGIVFVLVGLGIVQTPEANYFTLTAVFALIFIVIGISQIFFAYSNRSTLSSWSWYLTNGILDFLVGFILISRPFFAIELLPTFIAFWLIYKSIYGISMSIELKEYGIRIWWALLSGSVALIILSMMLVAYPVIELDAVVNTTTSFIILGSIMITGSLSIRNLHKIPTKLINQYTNTL